MLLELPGFFIDKMRNFFPDESEAYFESFKEQAHMGLRANTLKISPQRLKEILGFALLPVKWCEEGFYYTVADRPAKSPFYHAGLFYIQEPSAMSPASVFDVKPGDRVLDICAAPGGKTTQLAAKLKNKGVLVANDASNTRCRALLKNIELMGITNALVLNETPERLSAKFTGYFDKILIDAPCSGEGMFRKDPDAVKNYTKYKSEQLSAAQKSILYHAHKMLRPGGDIMYSTCTFSPDEDEMIIGWFLNSVKGYQIMDIDGRYGFDKGNPSFFKDADIDGIAKTARLWPHKLKGEGHFLAWLKKNADSDYGELPTKQHFKKPPGIKSFYEFCDENLHNMPEGAGDLLASHGDSLFKMPEGLPDISGLRIIRMGFYLGDIRKNRFEPSQALAMSLNKDDAKRVVDFAADDEDLYRYLRGESFEVSCGDGYCLVCVCGYPLGFGKVLSGRLKNKYLKSWIMN